MSFVIRKQQVVKVSVIARIKTLNMAESTSGKLAMQLSCKMKREFYQ